MWRYLRGPQVGAIPERVELRRPTRGGAVPAAAARGSTVPARPAPLPSFPQSPPPAPSLPLLHSPEPRQTPLRPRPAPPPRLPEPRRRPRTPCPGGHGGAPGLPTLCLGAFAPPAAPCRLPAPLGAQRFRAPRAGIPAGGSGRGVLGAGVGGQRSWVPWEKGAG